MLKGHPKGLLVAFFANMGERFGYYTMLAIFVLYLQAKFGFSTAEAGGIYGGFLFGIYFLPLLGGYIADNVLGYGKTITLGTVVMFLGYLLLAMPGMGIAMVYSALAVISLGTGFFKGNLQALVGNLYDDPKYSANRDNAFNIFYMGINIGAFFAPSAAEAIGNWVLKGKNFTYDSSIPHLAHQYLDGKLEDVSRLTELAKAQMGANFTDLASFSKDYIDTLGQSYNAGFAVAAASMVISFLIFIGFRKYYKHADITEKQKAKSAEHKDKLVVLTPQQTKERLIALGLVFFVVIFFWMAFHQNGFTMTIFARDYTQLGHVKPSTYVLFDLSQLLPILFAIIGSILLISGKSGRTKLIGGAVTLAGAALAYYTISSFSGDYTITPQKFQQFNPIFIVFLTPVIIGIFTWLRNKGKEPSAPKKIGIGMVITAIGFGLLITASMGLTSPGQLNGGVSENLVSPYWLINCYLVLTVAELFLSPIGISFVSKVAPPKYKGLAQGGWLGATAFGNLAAGLIGILWDKIELWQFFAILVVMCVLSAGFIFGILKRLEQATNNA
ncbi:peptide MFS transporter [Gaoshiqia sediminis]|uniref:Peptide MFS transporter n=1 Tax=Gaoshiqia sediminis TaxID=2986998 RepID=A0AA42CAC2_9BACT|nr:peptide MFS transporter [Gaoshiqia sediminis]MCW0483305.1 peptide MFS transporter [Gaoshiqia sediminis]